MPKIFDTSWLAVILATIVAFMIGAIWYGPLFGEVWQAASGMTEERTSASMERKGIMMWVSGLAITFGQAIGVLMVIHLAGAKRLPACLKAAFFLWLTVAAPIMGYACTWQDYPIEGFWVDASSALIGYLTMAAIYAAFRGKDKVG